MIKFLRNLWRKLFQPAQFGPFIVDQWHGEADAFAILVVDDQVKHLPYRIYLARDTGGYIVYRLSGEETLVCDRLPRHMAEIAIGLDWDERNGS